MRWRTESRNAAQGVSYRTTPLSPQTRVPNPGLPSGEQFADDAGGFDAGELGVEALELERQPLVVEAEQVQDRGVQVVDVDAVLRGVEAELVALAEREARLSRRRRPATS